jgi:hypothetical protein
MNWKSLLVLGIVAMFIFGCTSPNQNGGSSTTSGSNHNQPTDQSGSSDGSGDQSGSGNQDSGSSNGGSSDGGSSGSSNPTDLSGMTYAAIMALNIPVECNITTTYEGTTSIVHIYYKDSANWRSEMLTPQLESCQKTISIFKDDEVYTGCEDGSMIPGCDWFLSVMDTETTENLQQNIEDLPASSYDYSDIPSSNIDCALWIYEESKLTPSGVICTQEDLMNMYSQ